MGESRTGFARALMEINVGLFRAKHTPEMAKAIPGAIRRWGPEYTGTGQHRRASSLGSWLMGRHGDGGIGASDNASAAKRLPISDRSVAADRDRESRS